MATASITSSDYYTWTSRQVISLIGPLEGASTRTTSRKKEKVQHGKQLVEWYEVKDDVRRLSCADNKCASEEAWVKFYDGEHNKDVAARQRGEALRDQRTVVEVLGDSVKVQARAARDDKIKARREGADYDPVEHAKGVAEHLNALQQVKAETSAGKRKYNLFSSKKK